MLNAHHELDIMIPRVNARVKKLIPINERFPRRPKVMILRACSFPCVVSFAVSARPCFNQLSRLIFDIIPFGNYLQVISIIEVISITLVYGGLGQHHFSTLWLRFTRSGLPLSPYSIPL